MVERVVGCGLGEGEREEEGEKGEEGGQAEHPVVNTRWFMFMKGLKGSECGAN